MSSCLTCEQLDKLAEQLLRDMGLYPGVAWDEIPTDLRGSLRRVAQAQREQGRKRGKQALVAVE